MEIQERTALLMPAFLKREIGIEDCLSLIGASKLPAV
jgi:hypothetical protein